MFQLLLESSLVSENIDYKGINAKSRIRNQMVKKEIGESTIVYRIREHHGAKSKVVNKNFLYRKVQEIYSLTVYSYPIFTLSKPKTIWFK